MFSLQQQIENHDDVMSWKHLPHYWPSLRRIYYSPVDSPHKGPAMQTFWFLFAVNPCKSCWTNHWITGDLRHHHAQVTSLQCPVIQFYFWNKSQNRDQRCIKGWICKELCWILAQLSLTLNEPETHGFVLRTVATDALVLKQTWRQESDFQLIFNPWIKLVCLIKAGPGNLIIISPVDWLPLERAVREDCRWPLKNGENSHCSVMQAYHPLWLRQSQPQKVDASQLETMCYNPLTVLLPPGFDYVAVYS